MEILIAIISLFVSIIALLMSLVFWIRQFRPIITACVRTVESGNVAIAYSLKIMNSGSIPAKNIKIQINESDVQQSLGSGASEKLKEMWLRSINKSIIYLLQNGDSASCSFGLTEENDLGFWRYGSEFPVLIIYEGWFGSKYKEKQLLKIQDSDSFTHYKWSSPD